jgi:hypothetical protein
MCILSLHLRAPGWQEVWANNKCVMQGSTSGQGASILQHHNAILNWNVKSQQQQNVSRARMGAIVLVRALVMVHTCARAPECTMHTRVRACTYAPRCTYFTVQLSALAHATHFVLLWHLHSQWSMRDRTPLGTATPRT